MTSSHVVSKLLPILVFAFVGNFEPRDDSIKMTMLEPLGNHQYAAAQSTTMSISMQHSKVYWAL